MIKSHYTLGNKLIVFTDKDAYSMEVQNAVQDLVYTEYKKKVSVIVVVNETAKRTRTFSL